MACQFNGRVATASAFFLLSSVVYSSFLRHLVTKKETGLLETIPDNPADTQNNDGQKSGVKRGTRAPRRAE